MYVILDALRPSLQHGRRRCCRGAVVGTMTPNNSPNIPLPYLAEHRVRYTKGVPCRDGKQQFHKMEESVLGRYRLQHCLGLPGLFRSCQYLNRFGSPLSKLDQHQGHYGPSPPARHHALGSSSKMRATQKISHLPPVPPPLPPPRPRFFCVSTDFCQSLLLGLL